MLGKTNAWIAFFAWFLIVTLLSSQDGISTVQASGRIVSFLMRVFNIPARYRSPLHITLRTLAHVVCFCVLGALLYLAMFVTWGQTQSVRWWAVGVCVVLGVMDEVKKLFVTGRHLSWTEAGINIGSAWFGIVATMMALHIFYRR